MFRFYGVDLFDLGSPWLSMRRLIVLLDHLPRESATVRAVVGDRARWGDTEHLLADLIDVAHWQMWQFSSAHSKKRPKRPKPIRRPGFEQQGVQKFGKARMTLADANRYLDRFRPRRG